MKEFMLIYKGGDPDWFATVTPEEMGETMAKWDAWMGDLQKNEQLVSGGSPLNYGGKRVDMDAVVTDISTPEFKELVSGYSIVMAEDMDAAVEIAKVCPIFNYPGTTCEVREVMNMDG
jgi:hypothetical protein